MDLSSPVHTFLTEAAELLDRIEETALEVERNPQDHEAVNRLFRAFHTIKGSGAMFGFDRVAAFTHHVESTLDRVRNGTLPASHRLVALLLAARDHLKVLLDRRDVAADLDARSAELIAGFTALAGSATPPPAEAAAPAVPAAPAAIVAGSAAPAATWRIRFRPNPTLPSAGLDPATLLDDLRSLGACAIVAATDAIPPLDALDPEQCLFAWEITLTTDRDLNAIKDVFVFAEDGSEIVIEPVAAAAAPDNQPPASPSAAPASSQPARGPAAVSAAPVATPATSVVAPPVIAPAGPAAPTDAIVRVPSSRLDRLVNLVGELVMNQSRLSQVASRVAHPELTLPVEVLERLIAEMRDAVLGIRMMPIGTTFGRFNRLVHDLSAELHKEIDLVTSGAETELDKTMLDRLGDPLVHLIRNSIDHGIELPAERLAAGKPARGTIRLTAVHTGSNVVLTIEDDGRGLDATAIRAKAVERKLIAPDAVLGEAELHQLVFQPGFSTAKQVTNVSGRGVGMDVVKRELESLRGTISLTSEPGRGTVISATLPLTLAIIEGLLVEVAGDRCILPMSAVLETVELGAAERARHNGRNLLPVRGELIPYLRLRDTFAAAGEPPAVEKVVIVRHGPDRLGLAVDRVLGSHQTVIQSLGRFFRAIGLFSGATIMGDGRVALILDLAGLVRFAAAHRDAAA